ncbi:type II toxin-antitoxin system HigB family toxin [Pseudanabaena sp. UWO311]|uniref:type II toxin-antitoxin system HigB family toxin n=1 Tax=Pseudanabaena sp. UWO311 TaxID=2487337 RepID=UPI001157299A|nr:type II toxin-antitoxin system HigB family toxin [Pseudanabaena sp. UWO311]TYQ27608.1 type II toxin-antitoxin system HigB family toxin [Pseudanabaena sp. UWO311]
MPIITRSRLIEFWAKHPDSKPSLLLWHKIAITAKWQNFIEVREVFASADQVKNLTVFNIGGNKYRLIAFIDYKYQKIFIRNILTHAEYDRNDWKKDDWYE